MRVAFPAPVPMQRVATPTCLPVRWSSWIREERRRPPVAPRGCLQSLVSVHSEEGKKRTHPRAIAPPLGLTLVASSPRL